MLQKISLQPQELQFLRESQCEDGYGNPPYVCCTADKTYSQTRPTPTVLQPVTTQRAITKEASPSNGMGNVLPEPPRCGPDPLDGKIYNGNDTALDQYPWMVLLEYKNSKLAILLLLLLYFR